MNNAYPTKETIVSLCKKLYLPCPDSFEQDWQYVVVDPERINEFLWLYNNDTSLTDNEKMTLGILILGSLNEALDGGKGIEDTWQASWDILKQDFHIHANTLRYWACWNEEDDTNWFPIARQIRSAIGSYKQSNQIAAAQQPHAPDQRNRGDFVD